MCSHSVVELHEGILMFVMVDYVRMMVKKSCKCGKYGLCEHLLFLFKCSVTKLVIM